MPISRSCRIPPGDAETVLAGQAHIEDQQVGSGLGDQAVEGRGIRRMPHVMPGAGQIIDEHAAQPGIVIDHDQIRHPASAGKSSRKSRRLSSEERRIAIAGGAETARSRAGAAFRGDLAGFRRKARHSPETIGAYREKMIEQRPKHGV
jgi:hypothetical protein